MRGGDAASRRPLVLPEARKAMLRIGLSIAEFESNLRMAGRRAAALECVHRQPDWNPPE